MTTTNGANDFDRLDQVADELAERLEQQGLLLRHEFTGYEEGIVAEEFQVVSGHATSITEEIRRTAEAQKLDSSEAILDIIVIENDDRDIVTWIHRSNRK